MQLPENLATQEWVQELIDKKLSEFTPSSGGGASVEELYPIGSLYITTAKTNPLETMIPGSKWEVIKEGNAIFTGNDNNLGTYVEAGLPNIDGYFLALRGSCGGAFYEAGGMAAIAKSTNNAIGQGNIEFDASESNPIYGKSSTVQPPSLYVKIFRRTA